MSVKIAIFGSGSGTNAENIIRYFKSSRLVEVVLVLSNKTDAYILERAKIHNIPSVVCVKNDFQNVDNLFPLLEKYQIDFVVLAGFLLQIPAALIHRYPNKIINIHPALLPKFGGKGMYGNKVHGKNQL